MKTLTLSLILGLGAFAAVPAAADTLTSRIVGHNPATHTITLSDKEILSYDPKTAQLSDELKAGDEVEIVFDGSEGDMSRIFSIKRLTD